MALTSESIAERTAARFLRASDLAQQALAERLMQPHAIVEVQQQTVVDQVLRRHALPPDGFRQTWPRHGSVG